MKRAATKVEGEETIPVVVARKMVRKKRSCRHGEEMSRCSSFRWPEDKTATEELWGGAD
jgi:hypothetical protein